MKVNLVLKKNMNRRDLSSPKKGKFEEKLILAKAVCLEENSFFKDLGNGYGTLLPKDETKIITK